MANFAQGPKSIALTEGDLLLYSALPFLQENLMNERVAGVHRNLERDFNRVRISPLIFSITSFLQVGSAFHNIFRNDRSFLVLVMSCFMNTDKYRKHTMEITRKIPNVCTSFTPSHPFINLGNRKRVKGEW